MAEGVGNWGDLREESWQLRSLLTWKFDEDWILLCITVYAFFIWYVPLFVNGRENFCWLFWGGTLREAGTEYVHWKDSSRQNA
jgi:hypothetical protein